MASDPPIASERVVKSIHVIRGEKVILDEDLADLYGVPTKQIVQAVKRNAERFPPDFAFQLTAAEWSNLRSQIVTSSGHGGRRHPPHAFTEHGALMAASVLNSAAAVQVGLQVVRAFVRIRKALAENEALARRVTVLERRAGTHEADLRALSSAFRELVETKPRRARRIGYQSNEKPDGDEAAMRPRRRSRRA